MLKKDDRSQQMVYYQVHFVQRSGIGLELIVSYPVPFRLGSVLTPPLRSPHHSWRNLLKLSTWRLPNILMLMSWVGNGSRQNGFYFLQRLARRI